MVRKEKISPFCGFVHALHVESKGVWNVVMSISDESSSDIMNQTSGSRAQKTSSKTLAKFEEACVIMICSIVDARLRRVMDLDGVLSRMRQLLHAQEAFSRRVSQYPM